MIFFWHVSVTIVSIETSNMELFMKIIGKFYLLTTSKKSSIINASQVRKYAFVGIVSHFINWSIGTEENPLFEYILG